MPDELGIQCDDFLRPAREHVLALRDKSVGTELVHDLLDYAIATSKADAGCIYLFIAATSRLRQIVSRNIPPELAAIELSLGEGVAGAAAANRTTQCIDHYPTHPLAREPFLSEGLQAVIAAPLLRDDRVLGVLTVTSYSAAFSVKSRRLIELIADHIAAAMAAAGDSMADLLRQR